MARFVAPVRMAGVEEPPKGRWFRFRLSTWLVLLALLPAYAGGVIKFLSAVAVAGSSNVSRGPIDDGWLTLALAVFLAWKAAWVVIDRRGRRSAALE
jgi:hypothetical protein